MRSGLRSVVTGESATAIAIVAQRDSPGRRSRPSARGERHPRKEAAVLETGACRQPALERKIVVRFTSPMHDRPDMWTPAHASKARQANELPALLSARKTAAFPSGVRVGVRRCSTPTSESWQGQF